MMSKSRATISNEDLARIIKMFSEYLICWKVGLQYGSRLYFEMGKPLEQEIKSGVKVHVGTSTLILEGYNWIISGPTGQIADSNAISPDITSSILQKMFEGRRLEAISFNKDNVQLVISFSGKLTTISTAQISGEYVDDNLCLWVLPDGSVLGCDPKIGFYEDGSKSPVHARNFAQT